MNKCITYYISGHGFGHARRAGEVIRRLLQVRPALEIHVRTAAPQWLFAGLDVRCEKVAIDAGAIEDTPLQVNAVKTLQSAAELISHRDRIVGPEAAFVRQSGSSLVVADIPFLAGDIAEAAGVPCIGIGNFTWDWIYQPYVNAIPGYDGLLQTIRASYQKMSAYLRLPLSHPTSLFAESIDMPLVARHATRNLQDVLTHIGIETSDPRPRVLIGMRGGLQTQSLTNAAEESGMVFLYPEPIPVALPATVRPVRIDERMTFIDILHACQAVVCKFGYGIVADCAATRVPLLWPRRTGFREEELFESEAPSFVGQREIPLEDFESGKWAGYLAQLMQAPFPQPPVGLDGARACAEYILSKLGA